LGSVAAPAAALHFTKQLVKRFELKGVHIEYSTLYLGLGSFRPVDVEDLTKHKMDSEHFIIPQQTADRVNYALDNKKRVCAVGSTSLRSLESSVSANNRLKPNDGWTDKFIFPPFEFKICNSFVTNFHMPESTLLMMAAAFGGFDLIKKAYNIAVEEKYRFLTYGDCMLII
jgi:S-adenosylmethionine:tRNA ribosyltransferase-isomerase